MRRLAFLLVAALPLAACDTGPTLGVGLGLGPGGMSVSPSVTGRVGRVNVGASL